MKSVIQNSNTKGRLIIHGPQDPFFNMACDEALGLCAAKPVLRFYQWEPPAVSLGYFQKPEELNPFLKELDNPPLVRRITGGGAIYHYKELTYSIISLPGILPLPTSVADSYKFLHKPFIQVLNDLGVPAQDNLENECRKVPVCFDSITPFDVTVGEKKILGSAQRRHKNYFLQHGSLPLEPNPFSQRATSIQEELGRTAEPDELILLLKQAVSSHIGIEFEQDNLTEEEQKIISELLETIYIDVRIT